MKTVQQHIASVESQFRALSTSRKNKLERDAKQFIAQNPGCADNSNFWRSLSARQVIAANCGK